MYLINLKPTTIYILFFEQKQDTLIINLCIAINKVKFLRSIFLRTYPIFFILVPKQNDIKDHSNLFYFAYYPEQVS